MQCIVGPLGLTSQRTKGITAIPITVPYVNYFDDDFELKEDYLEQAVAFMNTNLSIIGISGRLLAGRGINREEAKNLFAGYQPRENSRGMFFSQGKRHILFGCNMAIHFKYV